jgi:hypothetical protein
LSIKLPKINLKMKLKKKDKKTNNDEEIIDKLRELND